ncbi:MAG: PQQ-binding-like beta-propeller repeat protein [Acidobacteria bacterium]|nr:PQQ-binding-like beta-propeller repeat protein [Acidobacteriota bacterium]
MPETPYHDKMRVSHGLILGAVSAIALAPMIAGDWTNWRGPNWNGTAVGDAPLEFSESKYVAWKTTIPGRGHSTPIIVGDRVFLTTAVAIGPEPAPGAQANRPRPGGPGGPGGRRGGPGGMAAGAGREQRYIVMCLDRKTGKILWEKTVKTGMPHEGYHARYGSYASNSPASDGKLVYAFFGSRGVHAFDMNGELKWQKEFPPMKMRLQFGEGTAPVLHDNYLILGFDQEEGSHVLVLDKTTGKQIWRAERDEQSAWAMPLVIDVNGVKQVVVSATNKVRSYDLKTGKVIWECSGLGANVIPAPVIDKGIVIVMSGFRNPNLLAIRPGEGDLTGSKNILWTNQKGNSYTASPVLADGKLYFISDNGMLSCLNAATGEPYYLQQRLPKPYNFKASPVAANGKLYLATEEGDVVVVKMGEKFEVIATNTMQDQMFISSPVIVDGAIYLRGQNTLYCIRN